MVICTDLGLLTHLTTVDNDFHQTDSIFRLFDGLEVLHMDETPSLSTTDAENVHASATNGGTNATNAANGGIKNETKVTEAQIDKVNAAPYT